MEFDMIGIDAALANAFRRILLSEVILENQKSVIDLWSDFVVVTKGSNNGYRKSLHNK